jgi:hypothetical protein
MAKALKLLRVTVPFMAIVLLAACGGAFWNPLSATTYDVSATAGTGGSISPSSAMVNAGGTTTFTVSSNSGYALGGVTGCGGTLSGNTYTTGAINGNCTVTASFSAGFTWVGGSSAVNDSGVYGTQGVAAVTNVPGARYGATRWMDASGNLWLFGGTGYGSTGSSGPLNDLWKYSPSGEWTWVSGSSIGGAKGIYGTRGVAAATNVPGGRAGAVSWMDASGNLWLFGGQVSASDWSGDLWEYSPQSGEWTWVSGSSAVNDSGVYGTQGVAAISNMPGARAAAVGWTDARGNLWLFGGIEDGSTGTGNDVNDLWKYSTQ